MPSTNDYFLNLKARTEAAALAKKQALDTAQSMATQATVDKDTGVITYNKDASGANKYGALDVNYMETQRQRAGGAEGSGTLRSGQYARAKLTDESDYRAKLLSLAADTAAQKSQIDTDTATQVAEYQAMYGSTSKPSQASSPVAAKPTTSIKQKITPVPVNPYEKQRKAMAEQKKKPKYDARRIGGL